MTGHGVADWEDDSAIDNHQGKEGTELELLCALFSAAENSQLEKPKRTALELALSARCQ